mmetsp:Transcript_42373/g.127010  ORF Transcript_42373/g.127010 Transcript_42373/m.127010 type:complete len:87 (-) Transcript_42373:1207-1467(-)
MQYKFSCSHSPNLLGVHARSATEDASKFSIDTGEACTSFPAPDSVHQTPCMCVQSCVITPHFKAASQWHLPVILQTSPSSAAAVTF